MSRAITMAALVIAVTGCANPLTRPEPKIEPFLKPQPGTISSASIGDSVISKGMKETFPAIDLSNKLALKGQFEASPGQYQIIAEAKNEFYVAPYSGPGPESRQGNIISLDEAYTGHLKLRIKKASKIACAVQNLGTVLTNWCSDVAANYTRTTGSAMSARSSNQSLIYLGTNAGIARFQYREFSGGYAKPTLETEAHYDLSESKVVTYKGATIQVIDASTQHIKYKLLSSFK